MSEIEQALNEVTELISLPEVYIRVRQLMDDPSSDIYDFAEVISVDPNLSTRVLKVVNSAYFGFPRPVESIARAVNMIGIGLLHNMVLGVSAVASIALPNDIVPLRTFWRSSLYCGVLARLLGEKMKLENSQTLFIAGLLHDIGHLVMYSKLPKQSAAARQISEEQGIPDHVAELQVFGQHYGDIGAQLMQCWNLPEFLQTLTRYQPVPADASDLQMECAVLHLAHGYALEEAKESGEPADIEGDVETLELTGISQEELENTLDEARSISADMEKVILA